MSTPPGTPSTIENVWDGVAPERQLLGTGWVGDTPRGEAAFLLMYPQRASMEGAAKLRLAAELHGLQPLTPGDPSLTNEVYIEFARGFLDLRSAHTQASIVTIPSHPEFTAVARAQGWVVVMFALGDFDPAEGIEPYITNGRPLCWGRARAEVAD